MTESSLYLHCDSMPMNNPNAVGTQALDSLPKRFAMAVIFSVPRGWGASQMPTSVPKRFDGIIPRGEKADTSAPDFWTKYPFKLKTVNNGNPMSLCKKQN